MAAPLLNLPPLLLPPRDVMAWVGERESQMEDAALLEVMAISRRRQRPMQQIIDDLRIGRVNGSLD